MTSDRRAALARELAEWLGLALIALAGGLVYPPLGVLLVGVALMLKANL